MLDAARQTVKKEVTAKEKRKEAILVLGGFVLFFAAYLFSTNLGVLSILGYAAAIAVVYFLYRTIKQYSLMYTYQIADGFLTVVQTEGRRNPTLLCEVSITSIAKIINTPPPSLESYHSVINASASEQNENNCYLVFTKQEDEYLLILTPNYRLQALLEKIIASNNTQNDNANIESEETH